METIELWKDDRIKDLEQQLAEKDTRIDELQKRLKPDYEWVDKRVTELDALLLQQDKEIAKHNEYFKCFACENFDEFQDFISTFMLTPHEEQTLIRELKNELKAIRHQVCDEIRAFVKDWNTITDENFEKEKHLYFEIVVEDFFEALKQIEKGENDD